MSAESQIRKEDGTPLLVDTPIAGSDTGLITALQEAGLPSDDGQGGVARAAGCR